MRAEITICTYRGQDLEALLDLTNVADEFDKLERATTLEQLRREMAWPGYLPETDCFLARAGEQLVAFSDIFLRKGEPAPAAGDANRDDASQSHAEGPPGAESIMFTWGLTHPAWRRRGLGRTLLERCHARAVERMPEVPPGPVYLQGGAREQEADRRALYERLGMVPVRYFVDMARSIGDALPAPEVPAGYHLRRFDPQLDVETMWRVETAAFADHWGFAGKPLEEFRQLLELPGHRPELSWLAEEDATGIAAGMALNRIDPDWIVQTGRREGMIGVLGVLSEHRRRGLGTALLAQSLQTLRREGMDFAHLWADSENLTGAVHLYERVGFRVRKMSVNYRLRLR